MSNYSDDSISRKARLSNSQPLYGNTITQPPLDLLLNQSIESVNLLMYKAQVEINEAQGNISSLSEAVSDLQNAFSTVCYPAQNRLKIYNPNDK